MTGDRPPAAPSGGGAPRVFCLVVENATSGSAPGRATAPPARFELTARETIVGRDPSCAVRLDDLFVSRRHARLLLRGSDLHLDDLASTNVTRRNGEPVRTRVRLQPGDLLQFASVRARLVEVFPDAPEAPEEPPPPPEPARPPAGSGAEGAGSGAGGAGSDTEEAEPRAPGPSRATPAVETPAPDPEVRAPDGSAVPAESKETAAGPEDRTPAPVDPPAVPDRSAGPDSPTGTDPPPGRDRREEADSPGRAESRRESPKRSEIRPPGTTPPGARIEGEPAPAREPRPERNPGVFVAGPLPGEAGRARVRAALWIVALTALAALGAALLR